MKKKVLLLGLIFVVVAYSALIKAQTTSAIVVTNVNARLIVPMTLTETSSLHFGTINVGSEAGTVILPSDSTNRIFSGVLGSAVSPLPTNAAYTVGGTKNSSYGLSLPTTITVTDADGSSMIIDNLKARFRGSSSDSSTSMLDSDGTDNFTLGGTLNVGANQIPGIYSGSFNVSVDYN